MGAGARISAYLGLNISPFEAALEKAGNLGGAFKQTLERKFGFKDVFKGVLAGIGLGSADALKELIVAPFRIGAEDASRAKEMTAQLADATLASIAAQGGLEKKLSINRQRFRDYNVEIEMTRKLLSEQEADPLRWAPQRAADLKATKDQLSGLIAEQGRLGSENDALSAELRLQNRELDRQLSKLTLNTNMVGKGLQVQIMAHRIRADLLEDEAKNRKGLTSEERTGLTKEAAGERAEAIINEKQLALFMEGHADRMRSLELARASLRQTSAEKVAALDKEATFLMQRSLDYSRTEAQQAEDRARAQELANAAEAEQLRRAVARRAIEDSINNIAEQTAALGETTSEKILRLRKDAAFYEARSNDLSRTEGERDADHVKAAQTAAEAAKTEYEWRNKPLTVADAARGGGTFATGVLARQIERYRTLADKARVQGRYDAAEHYDSLGRSKTDEFEKRDRSGRIAAQERAKGLPAPGSWDERYSAQLDARNARIDAHYGDPYASKGSAAEAAKADAAGDLKSAAAELKSAAAELKNVEVSVDVD